MKFMNTNSLPQGFDYINTISDPWSIKPKSYNFMKELSKSKEVLLKIHQDKVKRINPCQGHAFSDEGAESLEELNIELPLKCIHFKDYNLCSCKNICEQCKID